uniref:Uncharacterized protein n=1 Tax=Arundo donax TaxID=35708 RepID=A0A0A8Y5E5_ARUDO
MDTSQWLTQKSGESSYSTKGRKWMLTLLEGGEKVFMS